MKFRNFCFIHFFVVVCFLFQTECENLGLETFYRTYVQRLQRSNLSIFFVMHTIIGMVHTIVLVATQVLFSLECITDFLKIEFDGFLLFIFILFFQTTAPISPEVYCYLASIIVVWVSLISSFKEELIKKQTWIPNFASVVTVIGLVCLDIIVPLYHSVRTHVMPPLRPTYDGYIIFAIYIFLPLPENLHSVILAFATTFCYLLVTNIMTYRLDEHALVKVSVCVFAFVRSTSMSHFIFFLIFSFLFISDIQWFSIFAWCEFFRCLCAAPKWSGYSKSVPWSSRMCGGKSFVTLCKRPRSIFNENQFDEFFFYNSMKKKKSLHSFTAKSIA